MHLGFPDISQFGEVNYTGLSCGVMYGWGWHSINRGFLRNHLIVQL